MEKVTSRDIAGRVTPSCSRWSPYASDPASSPVVGETFSSTSPHTRCCVPIGRGWARARTQAALSPANSRYPLYLSFSPSLFLSLSLARALSRSLALALSLSLSISLSLSLAHTHTHPLSLSQSQLPTASRWLHEAARCLSGGANRLFQLP